MVEEKSLLTKIDCYHRMETPLESYFEDIANFLPSGPYSFCLQERWWKSTDEWKSFIDLIFGFFQTTVPSLPSLPSVSSLPPWSSGTEVTLDSPQTPTTDTHTARELTTRDTTHQASRPAMESSPVSSKINISLSFSLSLSLDSLFFFTDLFPVTKLSLVCEASAVARADFLKFVDKLS